jgi:hypothetical protein
MSLTKTLTAMTFAALAGFLAAGTTANAENAIKAPAQKTIGQPKTQIVPSLIVLNADGATLSGATLTLTGIASNSIIFADRPVRSAGHALTAHLIEEWGEGSDSFAKDPPNATVSVFSKAGDDVEDAVVVLRNPRMESSNLTFTVEVLESNIGKADGPASVFIDIIGMPMTPLSYAGVARRTAYRGAFYAGAAAAAAHPLCGYYPYPPCY